ncbi:Uma2 family endonuclease [Hydrogenivirga sp.]
MISIPTKRWTYEDYYRLDDEKRYEIIRGELVESPAPSTTHQRLVKRLLSILDEFVEKKKLGEVFVSPVDVVLSEENVVQPDLVFVSKENTGIIKERGIFGSPDLVVEVISPSTLKRDTEDKKELYAEFGVRELWLVFPGEKAVEVFILRDGRYEVCSFAYEGGKAKSCVLKGLELNLEKLFKEVQ